MALRIYNSLTKKRETFEPLRPGRVSMYNCGPTVYSYAHIGNFASFLMADILRRHLEYSGFEVLQVMNITDVGHLTVDDVADAQGEDKLERKAREEKKDPWEIARFYEDAFHEDRKLLNLLPAHQFPRATEHIQEMIRLIEELLAARYAYVAGGQVYYSISSFPQYGLLSGNTTDELLAGHRVESDPVKRNPLDFTLWKQDPKHIMKWDSPWGEGFPGWHIECSAMSRRYLGEEFDIHTGGEDNIFPHHECEIAQSWPSVQRPFARYWLHRRHILVDKKKMSKSAGNFYTIRDLVGLGFSGAEIRFVLVSAHYRTNLNFTIDGLRAARETLRYLREFLANMRSLPQDVAGERVSRELAAVRRLGEAADARFRDAMDDDLNVSAALAQVHGFVREAYKACTTRDAGEAACQRLLGWDGVLGVLGTPSEDERPGAARGSGQGSGLTDDEIEDLLARRREARGGRRFEEADRIRDVLAKAGIVVKDLPERTVWHREL